MYVCLKKKREKITIMSSFCHVFLFDEDLIFFLLTFFFFLNEKIWMNSCYSIFFLKTTGCINNMVAIIKFIKIKSLY